MKKNLFLFATLTLLSVMPAAVSAQTPDTETFPCGVQAIPYAYDFEEADPFGCWERLSGTSDRHQSNNYNHTDGGSYDLRFKGTLSNLYLLPEFVQETSSLQLQFWTHPESIGSGKSGSFSVGYLTDPADTATFVAVTTYRYDEWPNTNYVQKTVFFTNAPAGARIAFRHNAESPYWFWFVDDVVVTQAPECLPPLFLTVTDTTSTSATLSWSAKGNETGWSLFYKTSSDSSFTEVPGINSNSFTLNGLANATDYDWYVVAHCEGESSNSDTSHFNTLCAVISEFPWTEDFESYSGGINLTTNNLPYCWYHINSCSYIYHQAAPYISNSTTFSHSGQKALFFTSFYENESSTYDTKDQYVILPAMDDLNSLKMTFYARDLTSPAFFGPSLRIGVMEGDTFVEIDTITLPSNKYTPHTTYFYPYQGTGNRIAIKMDAAYSETGNNYKTIYVDDITVERIPDCPMPLLQPATAVTSHEATISWTAHSSATAVNLHYKKGNAAQYTTVANVSSPYILSGLSSNATYSYFVEAVCAATGDIATSDTGHFNTECVVIAEFPWTEDFEDVVGATSDEGSALPLCWSRINNSDYLKRYPYVRSHNQFSHSGNKHLRFYTNNNMDSDMPGALDQYAILPEMANLNTLKITLYARKDQASSNYEASFHVGVMEGDTFIAIETFTPTGTTYMPYTVYFIDYTGTGNRIAIKTDSPQPLELGYQYMTILIDDITVEEISGCVPATNIALTDITSHDATLTWVSHGTGSTYDVCYKRASDSTFIQVTDATTPFSLSGLQLATDYEVYLTTHCGDGAILHSDTLSFVTLCDVTSLPYSYDFEDNSPFNCWTNLSGITENMSGNNNHTPNGFHYLRFRNSFSSIIVLPEFEQEANALQLTFWTRPENFRYSECGSFSVGYLTDPADTSTFVAVRTYSYNDWTENTYQEKREYFVDAPAGSRIAFRHNSADIYWYWFLDDVTVSAAPACIPPDHVTTSNIKSNSASISWENSGEVVSWRIYYKSAAEATFTEVAGIAQPSALLTGLQADTEYECYVVAVCDGNNTSSSSDTVAFHTACLPFSLPYSYDFEDEMPFLCWKNLTGTSARVEKDEANHTPQGYSGLQFQSPSAPSRYVLLPEFEEGSRSYQLTFWTRPEAIFHDYSGTFSVGYLTNPDDTSTFTAVNTYTCGDWSQLVMEKKTEFIFDLPAGARIAFRNVPNNKAYWWYLDDVEVSEAASCIQPQNVTASEIGTTQATLDWTTMNGETAWNVFYKRSSDSAYTEIPNVTQHPIVLDGLHPSSDYACYVVAVCDDEDFSAPSNTLRFATECTVITEFPWTENFDGLIGAKNEGVSILPNCWDHVNSTSYVYLQGLPNIYSDTNRSRSGENSLFFYSAYSTEVPNWDPQDEYAILPEMEDLSTLKMTLYASGYNFAGKKYDNTLKVGVMEGDQFVELASFNPAGIDYERHTIYFYTYQGTGNRIAIMAPAAHTPDSNLTFWHSAYVDDITIERISSCPAAIHLQASDITGHSAVLSWDSHSSATDFDVFYKGHGDSTYTEVQHVTSPYTLNGLEMSVPYDFFVKSVCESGSTCSDTVRFVTVCETHPIPYTYDFEDENPFLCWESVIGITRRIEDANMNHTEGDASHILRFSEGPVRYMLLPEFELGAEALALTFWTRPEITYKNYCGTFSVGYMTDPADTSTFTAVATYNYSDWTPLVYTKKTEYFYGAPDGARIAFRHVPNHSAYWWYVDDVTVTAAPTCFPPTGLTVSDITTQSATIGWMHHPEESAWNIHYKKSTDTVFTVVSVTQNPVTLTGLEPSSIYDLFVVADCGGGDLSVPSDTLRFFTTCDVISTFPWTEDFETYDEGDFIVPCWENERLVDGTGNGSLYIYKINTSSFYGDNTHKLTLPDMKNGSVTKLVLPEMNLPENFHFSIDVCRNASSTNYLNEGVRVLASPDGELENAVELGFLYRNYTRTDGGVVTAEASSGWYTYTFPIPISGPCRIILKGESSYGSSTYMDNFVVERTPSCLPPQQLTVGNIQTNEASLSWVPDGDETTWNLYYKRTSDTGFTVVAGITSNPYTLQGLETATAYECYLETVCDDGTTSRPTQTVGFTTSCEIRPVPYTYDFETADEFVCWTPVSGDQSRYNYANHTDNGTYSLRFGGAYHRLILLPELETETNQLQITFWSRPSSITSNGCGTLSVGYVTDPNDESTFTPVGTYNGQNWTSSVFMPQTEYLMDAPEGARIAFRHDPNSISYYWYVDDVEVTPLPGCLRPTHLTTSNITTHSADLRWVSLDGGDRWNLYYRSESDTGYTEIPNVTENPYTLTGLQPSTRYEYYLESVCEDEGVSIPSATVRFITECMPITEYPWTEDFEGVIGTIYDSVKNLPACWKQINNISNPNFAGRPNVFKNTNYALSGNNSLEFYSYRGSSTANVCPEQYAILPPMEQLNTLKMTLYARAFSSNNATFRVGVMEGDQFVPLKTITPGLSYRSYTVYFDTYDGPGYHIAIMIDSIRHNDGLNSRDLLIDDIVVEPIPGCVSPDGLTATGITTESATLDWVSHGDGETWNLYYKKNSEAEFTEVAGVTKPYTLTGLTSSSTYQFFVKTVCDEGVLSGPSEEAVFNTECGIITDFPWTESFESVPAVSGTNTLPICWDYINTSTHSSYRHYPTINSSPHSGHQSLKLDSYTSQYGDYDPQDQYAILPAMSDLSNLKMSLYAKTSYSNMTNEDDATFHVGVMEENGQFVEIQTISPETNNYTHYTVYFNNYSGTGNRIAIKLDAAQLSGTQTRLYKEVVIDDITVDVLLTCMEPTGLAVTNIVSDSATLSWTANNGESAWRIHYKKESDSDYTVVSAESNPFTLTGLTSASIYQCYVTAICSETEESLPSEAIRFTTECGNLPLPYLYDFETVESFNCWKVLTGANDRRSNVNYNHTEGGTNYLDFRGSLSNIVVLPEFELEANQLQLTFWTRPESYSYSNCGSFSVGYLTDPTDTSTFVAINTYNRNEWTNNLYARKTEYFSDAPEGARIAFRHNALATNYYWFVDDIEVRAVNACQPPILPTADNISNESATLNWTAQNGESAWKLYYKKESEVLYTEVPVTTKPYTLAGLEPNTEYTFYVTAMCDDGGESYGSDLQSFTTACALLSTPYRYDFENEKPFRCWASLSGSSDLINNNSNNHTTDGTSYLRFQGSLSNIMVLPEFEEATNTLQLIFWTRPEKYSYQQCGTFSVGYITNMADTSTFVALNTYSYDDWTSNTYLRKIVPLNGAPAGARIAFRQNAKSDIYYWYVDDVEVVSLNYCWSPDAIVADDITFNTATLSWNGMSDSYTIRYRTADTLIASLEEGFENGLGQWTLLNYDASTGINSGFSHSGNKAFLFAKNIYPPQTLILNEISETPVGATVSFYYKNNNSSYPNSFRVGTSSTTNASSAFTYGETVNTSGAQWTLYSEEIPAGTKYVAIQYTSNNMSDFYLDDLTIGIPVSAGEWQTTTSGIPAKTLSGLQHSTLYEAQVQGNCNTGTVSDWSESVKFCTAHGIVPTWIEVDGTLSVCQGKSTTLTATSDVEGTFSWSNGATGPQVTVEAGTYTATVTTLSGDQLSKTVTVASKPLSYKDVYQTSCVQYTWNGNIYTASGDYPMTFTAANGCDSVVTLHLTVNPTTHTDLYHTECGQFTWHGDTYTASGEYEKTFTAANGCDSVVTLHLTVNPTYNITDSRTICPAALPYTWNGVVFTSAGTQTITLHTINGCDSVVTMTVEVGNTYQISESRKICDVELPYTWNGFTFTAAGTQSVTLQAANGCDSVIIMQLTVNLTTNLHVDVSACDSYEWDGVTYTESGDYTRTFTSMAGCDSVVTLHLTINPTVTELVEATACDSYEWNGVIYTESGEHVQTFSNAAGCDSIVTLHLTINPTVTELVEASACDSYEWNGVTYTQSGDFPMTFTAANGCDSVITLRLTIHPSYHLTESRVICPAALPYVWNGMTFTSAGTQTLTTQTVGGCDSVVTMTVSVNDSYLVDETVEICSFELPYTWNDFTFTAAGTQSVTLQAANGCDSVVNMHLIVHNPVETDLYESTCDAYIWNGVTYTQSGNYAQAFTATNGCDSIVTLHLTINHPVAELVEATACDSYEWNGVTYNESGDYTQTFTNAAGCDSVVTLHLTVNATNHTELVETACDNFVWNGVTYNESGDYTQTFTNAAGCDSVVTLHLTVNATDLTELVETTCDSYEWNGVTYNESGDYSQTFTNAAGCDSVVTLHLTVNSTDLTDLVETACDSYEWNGVTYDESGDYTQTFTNAAGCDSVVTLHLTMNSTDLTDLVETACDNFVWNGVTYNESGDYTQTFTNAEGCDSVVTLHLTVNATDLTELVETACGSYEWNGVTYNESGDYTQTFTNAAGCDSVVTLHLTVNSTNHTDLVETACDSYEWNGVTYDESGDYTQTFTNAAGCDSVVTLHLTINQTVAELVEATACDSYEWNGVTYNESGDYTQTFTNAEGCDSVVTLHLTVNSTDLTDLVETACGNYEWNGVMYNESGDYTQTFTNAAGCDSVVTLHLTVNATDFTELVETACGSYEWNGVTYNESGDYTQTFTNAAGCDSVVTLHLTVNSADHTDLVETACGSYEWNGVTYNESGDYTQTFTNAAGCDSVVTLHLTIFLPVNDTVEASACGSYFWNNANYTESGDYTATFTAANGCDSLVTLHLTISHSVQTDLYETACDSYTWTDSNTYTQSNDYSMTLTAANGCDSVVVLHLTINQSTASEFVVETSEACYTWNGTEYCESGDYTQTFTAANGCDSVVTLHLTTSVGIGDHELNASVTLYPNPANDFVNVQCTMYNVKMSADLHVFDVYGKLVQVVPMTGETTAVNVSTLADGVYFVRVRTEAGTVTKRFVVKR